jgi:hypothetical protein
MSSNSLLHCSAWVQNIVSYLLYSEPNTRAGIGVGLTREEKVVWFEAQCTNDEVKEMILKSKSKSKSECESKKSSECKSEKSSEKLSECKSEKSSECKSKSKSEKSSECKSEKSSECSDVLHTVESPQVVDITASSIANIDYINNLYKCSSSESECDSDSGLTSKKRDCRDNVVTHTQTTPNRRRCFKSHSQLGLVEPLLTSQGRVIHIARNPKDVAVSLWHHTCTKDFGYNGDFTHFLEVMFVNGLVESGSWWDYVIPYWLASIRTEEMSSNGVSECSKVLTIWYEDLIAFPETNIRRIANFLNISDITTERINEISSLCSFDSMKATQSTGGVVLKERNIPGTGDSGSVDVPNANQIRKGGIGGWKEYFSSEQCDAFDRKHNEEVTRSMAEFMHYIDGDEDELSTFTTDFHSDITWR